MLNMKQLSVVNQLLQRDFQSHYIQKWSCPEYGQQRGSVCFLGRIRLSWQCRNHVRKILQSKPKPWEECDVAILDLLWQYNISFDMESRKLKLLNFCILTLTSTFKVLSNVMAYVYLVNIYIIISLKLHKGRKGFTYQVDRQQPSGRVEYTESGVITTIVSTRSRRLAAGIIPKSS